jgi:hypothetical protein
MAGNKRISLIRLQPKFEMLIRSWVEDRKDQGMNFGILADMVGVHPTHLSNLICRKKKGDPNSAYRRPLTSFYVEPFLDRGVFTMVQFYEDAPDTQDREREWALRMSFSHSKEGRDFILEAAKAVQEGYPLQRVRDFIRGMRANAAPSKHVVKPIQIQKSDK